MEDSTTQSPVPMIGYRYFSRGHRPIGLLDDVPSHVEAIDRLWLDRADRTLLHAEWSGFSDCATSTQRGVAVEPKDSVSDGPDLLLPYPLQLRRKEECGTTSTYLTHHRSGNITHSTIGSAYSNWHAPAFNSIRNLSQRYSEDAHAIIATSIMIHGFDTILLSSLQYNTDHAAVKPLLPHPTQRQHKIRRSRPRCSKE